jgi:GNAT superfamily N-acetyltransferase
MMIRSIRETATLAAPEDSYVLGLRWLAESVLPAGHPGLDLPAPVRVHLGSGNPLIRDYLLRVARSPQPGGNFDLKTASLRLLPDSLLLRALLRLRYSGLIFASDETVIGHLFDQQHGDRLHAFSIAVDPQFEGRGYAQVISLDYLSYASQRDDIAAVRFGHKRNAFSRAIMKTLRKHEQRLGWRISDDGWIEFPRQN